LAKEIVDQCSAGRVKNIAQLRETIFAHSRFKILLSSDSKVALLDEDRAAAALDDADILAKIKESKVYEIAAAKLAQGKPFDAERKPVAKLIEQNLARLQKADDNAFFTTVGLLALDSSRLYREMPHLQQLMDLAVCAHNLRQMGIAFHLYLLDHQMCFPPLSSEGKTTIQGKEVAATTFYQDLLKPYFGLPPGEWVEWNSICREIPADSVFQCPAAPAPWKFGNTCQYGYHDIWPNSMSSGKMKFSAIKPEQQLLVADVCYFGSPNGVGISRLYSFDTLCPRHGGYVNVLYADGHVNAEDMDWLWKADGNGIPWNSNKPHAKRNITGSWPYKPPATDD
jgi:prepilin-type processing-associated H-X9-DG protein